MPHEVSGDIRSFTASVIARGVAPSDAIQSGLALQPRERITAMYRDFRHYCRSTHDRPGDLGA
ncbi:MAG: hypothetical protein KF864_13290 [Phycisphaeraceae bacterium]|nr:hypothetical protein [Phycisphaeraceae bacterium]